MSKITPEDHIDPEYKRLIKRKRGKKLIQVLKLLCEGIMTRSKIQRRTKFSISEVRELTNLGIKKGYIKRYSITDKLHRSPGRPQLYESIRNLGRRPDYFCLSGNGKWLMRFDPNVRDRWEQLGVKHEGIVEQTEFDSYTDFIYAIRKNPTLNKYRKPYYYMDQELERTALNPFLFVGFLKVEDAEQLHNELINVLKESVASEHIVSYYLALESGIKELYEILSRHRLLLEKMKTLKEVQQYLKKQATPNYS